MLNNAKDAYNSKKEIEKRIIKIRVYKNNNLKIIEISDFAGGISSDIFENIFNLYTTKDKDKEHGSGLGLYLTKQIVEKHNGNIIAFNHNKNGATFQATFL
ncbi:ATP-binding protein [Aliarcobacter skirrowii]|uniref:ATP-binding protein n=1 Tax=Aliarcobacter skirrowii TaxID=28200 RepID=UPI003D17DCB2